MILLSVIVPVYNSAKWLDKCLTSLCHQDIAPDEYEVICVNDGSPDNSVDIIRRYQQDYPFIRLFEQENQGPSGARNNGMRHAQGRYMCFVDPDDYVEEYVYGSLVRQMEEQNLDALRFDYFTENEQYQPVQEVKHPIPFDYSPCLMSGNQFIASRLQFACYIWLYMFRRSIITDNQIWCYTGDYFDDTPWLPLVLQKAERMNILSRKIQHYIIRDGSLVRANTPKMIQRKIDGAKFVLDTMSHQLESISDAGVRRWYRMMMSHCAFGLINQVMRYRHEEVDAAIAYVKQLGLYPLSIAKSSFHAKVKMMIYNVSPYLYQIICKML